MSITRYTILIIVWIFQARCARSRCTVLNDQSFHRRRRSASYVVTGRFNVLPVIPPDVLTRIARAKTNTTPKKAIFPTCYPQKLSTVLFLTDFRQACIIQITYQRMILGNEVTKGKQYASLIKKPGSPSDPQPLPSGVCATKISGRGGSRCSRRFNFRNGRRFSRTNG